MRSRTIVPVLAALMVLTAAGPLAAEAPVAGPGGFMQGGGSGYEPLVPVSAFARPAGWFDSSRLRISTTVSVGTGWGGGTDALQVTSLAYQLAAPLSVRLSVGNAFGSSAVGNARGMFLEGFAVAYRPHPSFQINVDYRDVRSPLQYSNHTGFGTYGR